MFVLTGLVFLSIYGDVLAKQTSWDDVIWFPIEDIKGGYSSSLGEVYLTSQPNSWGFVNAGRRKFRSVPGDSRWNGFHSEERRNVEDAIVFPDRVVGAGRENVAECERSCPNTPQYNPVCGSDMKNYANMGALKCSQLCGNGVRFVHYGTCGKGLPFVFRPSPRPPRKGRRDDVNRNNW